MPITVNQDVRYFSFNLYLIQISAGVEQKSIAEKWVAVFTNQLVLKYEFHKRPPFPTFGHHKWVLQKYNKSQKFMKVIAREKIFFTLDLSVGIFLANYFDRLKKGVYCVILVQNFALLSEYLV